MTNKQEFINFVDSMIAAGNVMPESAASYYETLKTRPEKIKPKFTENGKVIINFLRQHEGEIFSSKDIADNTPLSTRAVSGSVRKLINDGHVQKIEGEETLRYTITASGMTANLDE